jgi:septation ring formation regulator EzrA
MKKRSESKFIKLYEAEISKPHFSYRISTAHLPKMMREIHQTLKSIEEDLKRVNNNIETLTDDQAMMQYDGVLSGQ